MCLTNASFLALVLALEETLDLLPQVIDIQGRPCITDYGQVLWKETAPHVK